MPQHSCVLKNPSDFETFDISKNSKQADGKFYDAVYGKLPGQTAWAEQAFLYDSETWTEAEAGSHCLLAGGSFQPAKSEQKAAPAGELKTRGASLKPASLDENSRTIRIIAATDGPVTIRDFQYGMIPEILQVENFKLPEGRDRVPFLDSHDRRSSRSVVGTVFNLQAAKGQITGVADISSASRDLFAKIIEGHLTDVSVGYTVNDARYIEDGETETISGRTIQGPAKIVTDFTIKEISAVPIGADVNSTIRSSDMTIENQNIDPERIRKEERERASEIRSMCTNFSLDELADDFINRGVSVESARKTIMERLLAGQPEGYGYRAPVTITADAGDKRHAATVDGLCLRAGIQVDNAAQGADEYRAVSLPDLARESLENAGVRTHGMSRERIVTEALSARSYHTTSDFSTLLADAAHKATLKSFQQAPATWRPFCRTTTVTDFRTHREVRLSDGPDLLKNEEAEEIQYGTFSDEGMTYSVKRHARLFSVSRNALVNDDTASLMKVPMAYGASAARLVNQSVWDLFVNNGTLDDGIAFFHDSHSNLVDSGGSPSTSQLDAMRKLMRKQTAPQGAILNIQPKYLLGPVAMETDFDQILNTQLGYDGSTNKINPFYQKLTPIVEPYLDSSSEKIYYMAADPGAVDTIIVAFMNGKEGPTVDSREGWEVLGMDFRAYIEFGCAVADYRSFVRNDGE